MKSFSTSITIQSSPETVWAILTDGAAWAAGNSTIDKVEGNIAPGNKITVYSKVNPGRAFQLKVSEFVPSQKMVWSGGMPLGLFKGQRTYTLTPKDNGLEFAMLEEFTGLMAPLITKSIPDLQPSFEAFAADLKRRAEIGN